MPVLSEDSGECPPPGLHLPGLPGLGGKQDKTKHKKNRTSAVVLALEAAACPPCRPKPAGRMLSVWDARESSQGQEIPLFLDLVCLASFSGLHETLALLTSQLRPDSNHREEMGFLRDVFSEKSLSYLMKVKARSASLPIPEGGSSLCHPSHFPVP